MSVRSAAFSWAKGSDTTVLSNLFLVICSSYFCSIGVACIVLYGERSRKRKRERKKGKEMYE